MRIYAKAAQLDPDRVAAWTRLIAQATALWAAKHNDPTWSTDLMDLAQALQQ